MKGKSGLALAVLVGGLISGCNLSGLGGDKTPTGEVVAVVDGQEITSRQLQAEMGNGLPTNAGELKRLEEQTLQEIIARKILAKAARDAGVDKTPDFAIEQQRQTETLLAQKLIAKVSDSVPPPTREEAESFVSNHPDIFAQRKLFTLDQIRITRPSDPHVLDGLKPLNTMDAVIAYLDQLHIKFDRQDSAFDSVGADPKVVDQLVKLPPHEVFVFPAGQFILINQIKDSRIEPFAGEPAVTYALNVLKRQHNEDAVKQEMGEVLAKGTKTVHLSKAFQPSPKAASQKAS